MTALILHHFDLSPFAEKARLIMGIKDLTWSSVQIPMIMPKPDLMPLTGGYRKTPVLQIGADIYCDTRLIAQELERRFPHASLFPDDSRGLSLALSHWSDTAFFQPGAALSMALADQVPEAVLADRRQFFNFMDFTNLRAKIPHLLAQLRANAWLLEQQLSNGRPYLLSNCAGWIDICAYFPLWMARTFAPKPVSELLSTFRCLADWESRMRAIGHGQRAEMDPQAALDIAESASPEDNVDVDASDPLKLRAGDLVAVTPEDYGKVPVVGELVRLNAEAVAIRRDHPRTGVVVTHFPRIGYQIERAHGTS